MSKLMREEAVSRPQIRSVGVRVALALACTAGLTVPAFAQGSKESQSVHLRNDCRLAAQTLLTGHPAPKTDWALSVISFCDESGGPALQALWISPSTDSAALEQLVAASARLLDQRVYTGVMAAVQNAGAPRSVRMAGLRVLAAFLNNTTLIVADDLAKPNADSTVISLFSTVSGGIGQTVGLQPVASSMPTDVRSLFAALAQTDSDPLIRRAGRALQSWFSRH